MKWYIRCKLNEKSAFRHLEKKNQRTACSRYFWLFQNIFSNQNNFGMKEEKYIRKRIFSKNDKNEVKSDRRSDRICSAVTSDGFAFKVPCTIFILWSIGKDWKVNVQIARPFWSAYIHIDATGDGRILSYVQFWIVLLIYYIRNYYFELQYCGPETCTAYGQYCTDTDKGPACRCSPGLQLNITNGLCVDFDEIQF